MNISVLAIEAQDFSKTDAFDLNYLNKELFKKGHDIKAVLDVGKSQIESAILLCNDISNYIIVYGDTKAFLNYFSEKYEIEKGAKSIQIEDKIYILLDSFSKENVSDLVIETLNKRMRICYVNKSFKVFNKTEKELKEVLSDQIKNKHKISFMFIESIMECEIIIRYPDTVAQFIIDTIFTDIRVVLGENLYSETGLNLAKSVINSLKLKNSTLSVAESFTGGGIFNNLVKIAGASQVLHEGILTYSNQSKIERLNVDPQIINVYGAVSIETVYEMAAGIIMNDKCDYCIATTGNAGPTSEKPNDNGLFFVAAGNMRGINIYKYKITDKPREYVMECGIKAALFHLYKKINESEFNELLAMHQNKNEEF